MLRLELKHQGLIDEKSAIQQLNQGLARKRAEYRFRGSFFGTFCVKTKSTARKM